MQGKIPFELEHLDPGLEICEELGSVPAIRGDGGFGLGYRFDHRLELPRQTWMSLAHHVQEEGLDRRQVREDTLPVPEPVPSSSVGDALPGLQQRQIEVAETQQCTPGPVQVVPGGGGILEEDTPRFLEGLEGPVRFGLEGAGRSWVRNLCPSIGLPLASGRKNQKETSKQP